MKILRNCCYIFVLTFLGMTILFGGGFGEQFVVGYADGFGALILAIAVNTSLASVNTYLLWNMWRHKNDNKDKGTVPPS